MANKRERSADPEVWERRHEYHRKRYQANPGYYRELSRQWAADNRETVRKKDRRRREREAEATYLDLTALDNGTCYLCGCRVDSGHVEHVVPVSRFSDYASDCDDEFASAVRLACEACNLSKHDKDPAQFILERLRAGLPLKSPHTVTCSGCPVLALTVRR